MSPSSPKSDFSNVIPRHHVRLASDTTRVSIPGQNPECEPQVTLIRDGDTVQAIEVICTCGKRVVLNCVY